MRILIIGATGTIARPVIMQLDKKGFRLRLFSRTIQPDSRTGSFEIVQGDLFNPEDLDHAMNGCEAVHISVAGVDEAVAVSAIVKAALDRKLKLISYISGCTVSEENRWFWMIDQKFRAEQAVINSGIPYMIFRPTWFFESLEKMVRNGKATMIGKQPHPWRWIAAEDFGRMLATAYSTPEARNRIFYTFGPRLYHMKELMERYVKARHPEIEKVSSVSLGMMRVIGFLTGKKALKTATSMFSYFEKVREPDKGEETDALLGRAETDFEKWME